MSAQKKPSSSSAPRVRLRVVRPRSGAGSTAARPAAPRVSWWVASVLSALVVAVGGWLVVTGLAVTSWLSAMAGPLSSSFVTGTRMWLLAHGAPARLGELEISLVPLGATLLIAIALAGGAQWAARQGINAKTPRVAAMASGSVALQVMGVTTATYTAVIMLVALLAGSPGAAGRAFFPTVAVSLLASLWGARTGARWRPTAAWPRWARAIPRAMGAAMGALLLGGLLVVAITTIQHWDRVMTLQRAIGGGPVAVMVIVLLHLAYAPTVILWGVSWLVGPGVLLGDESVVSMAGNHVGLLPALPWFGAVPNSGPAPAGQALWLVVPIAAGALAGWIVVRSRRRARFDETALVGGLAGVLAGLAITGLCLLSVGGLGSLRLARMGPRVSELAALGPSVLGLAGMAAGLIFGLLRPPAGTPDDDGDDAEDTTHLRRR